MPNETFRIIYCSRNVIDPSASREAVEQILSTSRRNNARDGVTGGLLYNEGTFVQTLEGDFEAVQATFERIQADERHADVVILQAETVQGPIFSEWAMAFAEPEDNAAAAALLSRAVADPNDRACDQVLGLLDQVIRNEPQLS